MLLASCNSGGNQDQDILELQATVLAMSSEQLKEPARQNETPAKPLPTYTPFPTYTPYPTLEPLPTLTPLPTLEPLPTYTPFPTYTPYPTPITPTATPTSVPTPTLTPTPHGYQSIVSQAGMVTLGNNGYQGTFAGVIDTPGDTDTYMFDAVKGQSLEVTMSSSVIDTLLELKDPDGQREMRVDDSGSGTNASLIRTLSKSGTYLIIASSATSGLSDFGAYNLSFTLNPKAN